MCGTGGWVSGSCEPEDPRLVLARQLVESDESLPALMSTHELRQSLTLYMQRLQGLVALISGDL